MVVCETSGKQSVTVCGLIRTEPEGPREAKEGGSVVATWLQPVGVRNLLESQMGQRGETESGQRAAATVSQVVPSAAFSCPSFLEIPSPSSPPSLTPLSLLPPFSLFLPLFSSSLLHCQIVRARSNYRPGVPQQHLRWGEGQCFWAL